MDSSVSKVRILVVEDEAIIAMHLAEVLLGFGYELAGSVNRSDEVVELVQSTKPDLVLMDIRLGTGADGITLAEEIYTCEGVPVVLVSAFVDSATLDRARLSGAFGFVTKPIDERQLKVAILIALEKSEEMAKSTTTTHS